MCKRNENKSKRRKFPRDGFKLNEQKTKNNFEVIHEYYMYTVEAVITYYMNIIA